VAAHPPYEGEINHHFKEFSSSMFKAHRYASMNKSVRAMESKITEAVLKRGSENLNISSRVRGSSSGGGGQMVSRMTFI